MDGYRVDADYNMTFEGRFSFGSMKYFHFPSFNKNAMCICGKTEKTQYSDA